MWQSAFKMGYGHPRTLHHLRPWHMRQAQLAHHSEKSMTPTSTVMHVAIFYRLKSQKIKYCPRGTKTWCNTRNSLQYVPPCHEFLLDIMYVIMHVNVMWAGCSILYTKCMWLSKMGANLKWMNLMKSPYRQRKDPRGEPSAPSAPRPMLQPPITAQIYIKVSAPPSPNSLLPRPACSIPFAVRKQRGDLFGTASSPFRAFCSAWCLQQIRETNTSPCVCTHLVSEVLSEWLVPFLIPPGLWQ